MNAEHQLILKDIYDINKYKHPQIVTNEYDITTQTKVHKCIALDKDVFIYEMNLIRQKYALPPITWWNILSDVSSKHIELLYKDCLLLIGITDFYPLVEQHEVFYSIRQEQLTVDSIVKHFTKDKKAMFHIRNINTTSIGCAVKCCLTVNSIVNYIIVCNFYIQL